MNIPYIDFKKYITSSLNCNFSANGLVLIRGSRISFDFYSIGNGIECSINAKRINGNGKIVVRANGIGKHYNVRSTTISNIFIDMNCGSSVDFIRNNDCSGEVLISSFEIILKNGEQDPLVMTANNKWSETLSACGGSKGIKLVDGILYASEGATLLDVTNISGVETDPPNVAIVRDRVIRFKFPCKILDIKIRDINRRSRFVFPTIPIPDLNTENIPRSTVVLAKASEIPLMINGSHNVSIIRHTATKEICVDLAVRNVFKSFSILKKPECSIIDNNISGLLNINGFSSRQWFNKVSSVCPNIKSGVCGLSICSINNLIENNAVWIEEFGEDVNRDVLSYLGNTNTIFTPSLKNWFYLKEVLSTRNIEIRGRLWPILNIDKSETPVEKYFIYFEKDRAITDLLISIWKNEWGKLYLVGTNAKIPEFAEYISEYEPYDNLYKTMLDAYGIIDIGKSNHYISGIIELAKVMGLRIITNNHRYLQETPYLITNSNINGMNAVQSVDLFTAIEKCIRSPVEPKKFDRYDFVKSINELKC